MKILVINCGSSSLKYQLIDMERETVTAKGLCERIGIEGSKLTHKVPDREDVVIETPMPDHSVAVKLVFNELTGEHGVVGSVDEIDAIGHRVLHGANKFTQSCVVTPEVKKVIRECFDLGPLHNPANLMGIEACEKVVPGKKNIAVFDTTFGMSLPEKAYYYAIPTEYYEKYGIRRYGFHGTSHAYVSGETIRFGKLDPEKARVIVCHLGNGASISASIGGKAIDTSMGLTPLEGLIMGTRSGDVDGAVIQFIANHEHKTADEVLNILNKKSGILGMSGVSSDFRDVEKAAAEGNHMAKVALEAFRYRVAKYIGAYAAAMNGVDAISFTAGVGENDKNARKRIVEEYLGYLGAKIDDERNNVRGEERLISSDDSRVKIFLIPTNEELAIARDTKRLVLG
ncbi:acetate kinase [Oribacterium sp. oral taxon 078 str. F0262]|uniref:acetate/propionate family kinase n=1 Tax=Oribacterium sp. oral taxon 078 TaxID=652706 RepID=UPI0001BCBFBD|nr:acetate kinase [Oribacterium sp. oral taxon 078]EFE90795.1 acetate kinase [Oribacterium sp. oral taxon 078 str. F0262]